MFRDFAPARVSGTFDLGNGLTELDQPYRCEGCGGMTQLLISPLILHPTDSAEALLVLAGAVDAVILIEEVLKGGR